MQYPETPAPVLRRATASFLALEEDELSFEAGDTVELLGESSSPGWLLGRRGQLVGLVPPGYFPDPPLARPPAFGPGSAACSSDQLNHHAASAAAAAVDADVLAAFMRFDRNGSGKLDYRELGSALATLQLDATTEQARCLLSNPMPNDSRCPMPMPNAQLRSHGYDQAAEASFNYAQPRWSHAHTCAHAHPRQPVLRAQAASLLSTFDIDGSGLMELAEFANLVAALRQGAAAAAAVPNLPAYQMQVQQMQQQAEGDVRAAFMSFDRNGSGRLR